MTKYLETLQSLFEYSEGDVTLSLHDGTTFTSSDFGDLSRVAEADSEPWIDLVTSTGQAVGIYVPGDPTVVTPAPSIVLGDGMIYMINAASVDGQQAGRHMVPLAALGPDAVWPEHWYKPQDLLVKTPASDVVVRLSTGRNRQEFQGKWKTDPAVFGQFAEFIQKHSVGTKDGTCFLQGECAGGARKAAAMIANYVLGVDLDSGAPLEQVIDTIQRNGLEAIIYTTHSHLKDTSVIKRDAFIKWADGAYETDDIVGIREYLIAKKGILPEILEKITVLDDGMHTEEGIVILVQHLPMPKFRAVFPLQDAFIFAKRGGTQQDAISEWKERYAGFCTDLGLFFDEKCVDPARLFYFPRHKKGDTFGSWHIVGKPLDLSKYNRVKMRRGKDGKRTAVPTNAFTAAAGDQVEQDPDRHVVNGYNLRPWAAKNSKRFEIEAMIQDLQPDLIREGRGNKSGVHIACPFEDEHTNFGGGGTFVVNASDAMEEGFEAGFAFVCTHNACSERDRLDFIKGLIEQEYIEVGDLSNRDYLLELEDDEEEEQDERTDLLAQSDEHRSNFAGDDVAIDDDFGDDEQTMLKAFNRRYAVIITSGGVKILREPSGTHAEDDVMFLSQHDVALLERTRYFYRQGSDKKTTKVEGFKAWLEWEKRRTYNGIVFSPGRKVPVSIYNLFRGWPYQARKGSWSILRDHIYENMCGSDDTLFDWLMTWLSHIIQRPDQKPGSTIVITGDKGTGKSTLFDYINRLLGKHGITVAQRKQIVGQFNGHLATTLLMVCEEAFWAADPQAEGVLKDMITNKSMLIERKGCDPIQSSNYTRMALISNSRWVVPASLKDERRFFVLNCSAARRGDTAYFDKLRHQMDNEGGLEAMMFELSTWKPVHGTWASLFTPPITEHLQTQQVESLSGVQKFMLELVKSGLYESTNPNLDTIELSEDRETMIYAVDMRTAVEDYVRMQFASDKARTSFDDISVIVCDWFGARETKMHLDGQTNMKRVFVFPPLSTARAKLRETKGLDIEAMPVEQVRKLSIR